ncbi:MAG: enoyl-CoA hydratase-related protein [Dehalococcoidia bacterium]
MHAVLPEMGATVWNRLLTKDEAREWDMKEPENLIYEKRDGIAYITINRPHALNAIDGPTADELKSVFIDFRDDPDAHIAILSGAGDRAFCAGADIKWMAAGKGKGPSRRFLLGLWEAKVWKPIIAAVRGYCLGGGLEVALACDLLVAADDAQFGFPEIRNLGGTPGAGGPFRAPRQIPLKIAMWMLMSGKPIPAEEAYRIGMVTAIVPSADVMDKATEMAQVILENPPLGVQRVKQITMRGLDAPVEYPVVFWDLYSAVQETPELLAERAGAATAFAEKREPPWRRKKQPE